MTKPVVDGVCELCGTIDPLLVEIDNELGCFAEQIPYPEGAEMRKRTPIPLAWCSNSSCYSNHFDRAEDFLYEVWMDRKESDPGLLVEEVSPLAVAELFLRVWDAGAFSDYLKYNLNNRFEIEEEEREEAEEEARALAEEEDEEEEEDS